MQIDDFINSASKVIGENNSKLERVAKKLLSIKNLPSPLGGEPVISRLQKQELSGVISGVDSGFVSKKLSFVDIAFIRVCGVIFFLEAGQLKKAEYVPAAFSLPEPVLLRSGLETDEAAQSMSLERLKQEVSLSVQVIKKYKPKYAFIDGSIVPQYQDKPRDTSELNMDYQGIIHLFQKLYTVAEQEGCTLISCVEDSRGRRFVELLKEKILPAAPLASPAELNGCFDASFLDYFLQEGERTFAFPYTGNIGSHAILKDYAPEWSESISVCYIKASSFDKPLRLEFLCKDKAKQKEVADRIASVVFSLASLHREYSYPSILIEADLRARLNEQDISVVFDKLLDTIGPKAQMRRNNRPFG